jgi:hypothetical protein
MRDNNIPEMRQTLSLAYLNYFIPRKSIIHTDTFT